MGCGYFGKLPVRGDFVSRDCPAGFLRIWEPFLEEGLNQAHFDLKDTWEESYMTMPVWRFLIEPVAGGGPLTGSVAGAVMPNVDRVGRKFPLVLVSEVDQAEETICPSKDWFDALENTLLRTLEEDAAFEDFQTETRSLKAPEATEHGCLLPDSVCQSGEGVSEVSSIFWTEARGKKYQFRFSGMPDAAAFKYFLKPELSGQGTGESMAGDVHGQSREDLQT